MKIKRIVKHVIDCDSYPSNPGGCSCRIIEHRKGGQLEFNPADISLHVSKNQTNNFPGIAGNLLWRELDRDGLHVLNANVLDYLLAHPELIPMEWKDKVVLFWGTTFRDNGHAYVAGIRWHNGGVWCDPGWCRWTATLSHHIHKFYSAAVLTKK